MVKHIVLWFSLTLAFILLMPLVNEPKDYVHRVQRDQNALKEAVGDSAADYIIGFSDELYTRAFENTGIHGWFDKKFKVIKPSTEEDELFGNEGSANADNVSQFMINYITSFFVSIYETIFRLTQLGYWVVYSSPFILAAAFDGLMRRQIKAESFQYTSPSKYNFMWHSIIAMFALVFIAFTIPTEIPALVYPLFVFVASMSIRSLLSNLQRSA